MQVRHMAPRIVRIVFREPVAPPPADWPARIEIVDVSATQWSLRVRGSTGPVVESLAGLPVADLDVREPRLEDVVIQVLPGGAVIAGDRLSSCATRWAG